MHFDDLAAIEEGMPSMLEEPMKKPMAINFSKPNRPNIINFFKRAKMAEIVRELQLYQDTPYQLQPVREIQEYIQSNLNAAVYNTENMFEKSLQLEPREPENERIAK